MCSALYDRLNLIDTNKSGKEDLALIRCRIVNSWFDFLFWDSDYLEFDPVCLAIWDETEQVWHSRL